ncbi:MAG: radical SAM protein [Planctomycetes bacterium]|nr:radical SAM protein [Planctomycetota bacterium]
MEAVPELRLLFWETTAGCNLECVHCRRLDVAKQLMTSDLTTVEGKALIDAIAAVGKPILVLSGGEPLFRPDIFELTEHAVGRGLPVSLATNGTLVNDAMADRIVASGIRRVAVSLDGPRADVHDEFRKQRGAFDGAIGALRRLRARGMSIQVNSTITRHNVRFVDDIYRLALELGADAFHVFLLVPVGCGLSIEESNQLPADEYERVLNWLYDRSRENKLHTRATCAPHYFRVMRQRAKAEGVQMQHAREGMAAMTKGCLAGSNICFVSQKGDVFPCGYLPLSAGNVRKQAFSEIWAHSPLFQDLRKPELLEGKCGICEYKKICMGCRARAWAATKNYLAEEPFCSYEPARSGAAAS